MRILLSATLCLGLFACKSADSGRTVDSSLSLTQVELIPKAQEKSLETAQAEAPAPVPQTRAEDILTATPCREEYVTTCPQDERDAPVRLVVNKKNNRLLPRDEQFAAYGRSPCEARRELARIACEKNIPFPALGFSAHPDPAAVVCLAPAEDCSGAPAQASRCSIESYLGEDLNLNQRPIAWGASECAARQQLRAELCRVGMGDADARRIKCEVETSVTSCPPKLDDCGDQAVYSECKIAAIGEVALKQPLTALGRSACEARYNLALQACRLPQPAQKSFVGMECKSLNGDLLPAAANAQPAPAVEKKIEKLLY